MLDNTGVKPKANKIIKNKIKVETLLTLSEEIFAMNSSFGVPKISMIRFN